VDLDAGMCGTAREAHLVDCQRSFRDQRDIANARSRDLVRAIGSQNRSRELGGLRCFEAQQIKSKSAREGGGVLRPYFLTEHHRFQAKLMPTKLTRSKCWPGARPWP
jgi:hypothetical protein